MFGCAGMVGEVQNRAHSKVVRIGARGTHLVVNASCVDCNRRIVRYLLIVQGQNTLKPFSHAHRKSARSVESAEVLSIVFSSYLVEFCMTPGYLSLEW